MTRIESRRRLILLITLILSPLSVAGETGDEGWTDLVALDAELVALGEPQTTDGVPQFGSEAIQHRASAVESIQARLARIDPSAWSVAGKVDFLLVWARANGMEFEHRVIRPWQRDPIFYLNLVRRTPYAELPSDDVGDSLSTVPLILQQARVNLTEPNGELADLSLFHLENFDGVGQGQPYRDNPPAGSIGWYIDLCHRLEKEQPIHTPTCKEALQAVQGFRDWLQERRPGMPASAGIGTENLEWYFRRVRLLPYGVDEIVLLGEREFHRYRTA